MARRGYARAMARRLFLILVVGLALALGPLRARAEVTPGGTAHPCVGRWAGVGKNTWSSEAWTIDMAIESPAGERCGTIEYPSLRCGGRLERCEDKGSGRLLIREYYTHNPGTCAPAGMLDIVCGADTMQWIWSGSGVTVRSTLRRVAPADAGAPTGSAKVPPPSVSAQPALPPGLPADAPPPAPPAPPPAPPPPAEPQGGGGLCSAAAPVRAPGLELSGVFGVAALALAVLRRRGLRAIVRPSG